MTAMRTTGETETMKVRCEKCEAEYNIDENRIPAEGLQVKCPRCAVMFLVSKGEAPSTAGRLFDFSENEPVLKNEPESTLPPLTPASQTPAAPQNLPPLPPIVDAPPPAAAGAKSKKLVEQKPIPGSEGVIFDFGEKDAGLGPGAATEPEPAALVRYKIRRKSGKVFGPFDAQTILRMLLDRQLQGNEEGSLDGENFKPLGEWAEFRDAVLLLIEEEPAVVTSPAVAKQPASKKAFSPLMEQDEAALVPKGIQIADPPAKKAKKSKTALWVAASIAVLALAGVGLFLVFANLFGNTGDSSSKTPKPAGQESASDQAIALAQKNFALDTHAGYRAVIDALEPLRQGGNKSMQGAYLLGLSYSALLRNYGANESFFQKAKEIANALKEQKSDAPETRKVEASLQILSNPAAAIGTLSPLLQKESKDKEALFLAGWAMAYQKNWAEAARYLDGVLVLDPDCAGALHALGEIQSLQGNFENAAGFYRKALEKNPRHVISAVELTRIVITSDDKLGEAKDLLAQVFGPSFGELSPSEQAKAYFLRARPPSDDREQAQKDLNAAIQLVPTRAEYPAALGVLLLENGEPQKALPVFEKALALDPKNTDALLGKGEALYKSGDVVKGRILLEQMAAKSLDDPRPRVLLGKISEDLALPEDALKLYREALQSSPLNLDASLSLASLLLKRDQTQEASNLLGEIANKNPEKAGVHVGLGELYLQQKSFQTAEEELLKAIQINPKLPAAHFHLANLYRDMQKYEQAEKEYQNLLALNSQYPNLANEYGTQLLATKRYAEALSLLQKALTANPRDDRLYVRAGMAADATGDTKAAINYFQTATGLNNKNVQAFFQLASVFQNKSTHDQALELFKRAAELDGKNAEIHFRMGQSLIALERSSDAIEEFRLAVKIDPNHMGTLMALGKLLLERDEDEEAIRYLSRAVREQPKQVDLLLALGEAHLKKGSKKKALEIFTSANKLKPNDKHALFLLGRANDVLNKKDQAIKFYELAIKADPSDSIPHYYLGFIFKANNKNKRALLEFQKYLKLRPDAPDAEAIQEEIDYLQ
jgi:cellulose synthase operon protein C